MDQAFNMRGLKGNARKPRHFNNLAPSIPPSFLSPLGIKNVEKEEKHRKRGEHQYTKFKGPYENEFMR